MDPLSITASIIAVLQAANAVVSVCYDYNSAITNSSWELPRVTEEVQSLRGVLESLAGLARRAESADAAAGIQLPTLRLLCEPGVGPLAKCLVELEALEKKLAPSKWGGPIGSRRRALIQALGWPLKEGDTKKTLQNIERFKVTLSLAITADEAAMTLEIKDMVRAIKDAASDAREDFNGLRQMRIDSQRKEIHQWLSAPDPSANYNKARDNWQATTGAWFVESKQFADWKTNTDSFLWLHGSAGCGKTILSSTIVEDVLCHYSNSDIAVVYFYFNFNDIEKQQHEKMIRSLITQLSIQRTTVPQPLESLFSSYMNGKRQPTADALLMTLRQMIDEFDETFIILDALDECRDRQELLGDIEEIAGWRLGKLHMLATSREERDIEKSLEPLVNEQRKIRIQSALVNDDIRVYVHERLLTDKGLSRWQKQPKVQEETVTILMDKADGLFRWVVCQLDALRKCLTLPMLRKALLSLPKTLNERYARILDNIDEDYGDYALKILQWLTHSTRPLQIEEVAEVIAIDVEGNPRFDSDRRLPEPQDILSICSSLVTTAEINEGPDGGSVPRSD